MPAMVPNGRLAMCHAMVRRNCLVVMRHGLPSGPGGMTGSSGLPKAVLMVLVVKVLATAITVGSGAVGGIFTPTLFVGAAVGYLFFGQLLRAILP